MARKKSAPGGGGKAKKAPKAAPRRAGAGAGFAGPGEPP